ncbi:hypothetical protein FBU59_006591, partial [Linderina macrospora]
MKNSAGIGYDSDNSSNASVKFVVQAANRPATARGKVAKSSLKKPALDLAKFASDDAFDAGNAYGHTRYQMPIDIAPHVAAYWDSGDQDTALNSNRSSQKSSATSSRDISPTRTHSRKSRSKKKHRIEMQPLRDREAEREEMKKANKAIMLHPAPVTALPGQPSADSLQPVPNQYSLHHGQAVKDTACPAVAADTMLEARRALIGHYMAPNQHIPLSNNIPRSSSLPVPHPRPAQGVKVIKPQSFVRPKSNPANTAPKTSQARTSSRPRELQSVEQQQQQASTRNRAQDHAQQKPVSSMEGVNKAPQSDIRRDLDKVAEELDSSQEFSFGNVIQNFSLA